MSKLQPSPSPERIRRSASRVAGRVWLGVLFVFLSGMTFAAGQLLPLVGSLSSRCLAVLVISVIWNAILLTAIAFKQSWARYTLAVCLVCFVVVQLLFIADVSGKRKLMQEEAIEVVVLLSISNLFAAIFLLTSADIRQISRSTVDK